MIRTLQTMNFEMIKQRAVELAKGVSVLPM